jgi:signal transduction histidine kinase
LKDNLLVRTLRGRLMLVASLATLPAFLFVVYVAAKERAAALDRAEADARYVASLASREHAHQVSGAARLLDRLAADPAASSSEQTLHTLLPSVLAGFPQIANLGVLSATGALQYSAVPPPLPVAMGDNSAFRESLHSRSVAVGGYQVGPIVGRPVLIIARAVRDARGEVRHVLFAALELAWLDQLAQQAHLPPGHTLLIVDRNGAVLARSSSGSAAPEHIATFGTMLARSHGMTRYTESDGIARLGVAAQLEGTRDVAIVVGVPESGVYGMANRVFYRDVAVLALLALLAVASSVLATDVSLLRDLRLLAHATRRFGEGDFSARAPLPGPKGEIRDLARAFNAMADALAAGHRESVHTQEQLRALTHKLLSVREEEAARIAQELHDELGQELSVLKLELERVRKTVLAHGGGKADEAVSLLDEIGDRVDGAVQSVRRISSELRPGVLDRLGLVAGLEWLLHEFGRRSRLEIDLTARGVEEPVSEEVSTALFRITQEALTNIVRHARASHVRAELEEREGRLTLTIADDGAGFDPRTAENAPSLGLLGIRERAARLGGEVRVQSAPGSGTMLAVTVNKAHAAA